MRRWIVFVALGVAVAALALSHRSPPATPSFTAVRQSWISSDGVLLDRDDRILDRRRVELGARRLDWIALEDISPALLATIIHAEDRRFWSHGGVDWLALAGAARDGLLRHKRRGASTITMQLAVLLDPALRRSGSLPAYKLRQIRAALALESHWSKRQILEAYFNRLGFRGDLVGIDAAARLLFGKTPDGLTHEDSLILAALLPSPAAPAATIATRACALDPSLRCPDLANLAERVLADRYDATDDGVAPHLATTLIEHAAAAVSTTLDREVQQFAIEALDRHVGRQAAHNMRDGAVLVADIASGAIRAYVASNRATSTAPHVDGIRAPRQAGSTLKPFLYGLAIEKGYLTAASLIDDSPINLNTASGLYLPQNYDRDFAGLVSVRTALASSLNIPAVRTLVLTGVEPFRDRLVDVGYAGIVHDGEYYGYSLALGSAEVTLWQQVAAYRALARGGVWSELSLHPGAIAPERRVMTVEAAAIIANILSDRTARVHTFGIDNSLATHFWSAVKTGTSKDMRDNWCIGFTSRFVVGVWVGNFEGDSMHDVSGVTGAAPIWQEVISALHETSEPPELPNGVITAEVRFDPAVEPPRRELFVAGSESAVSRALAEAAVNIVIASPANGVIVAIDPDLPTDHQRIPFTIRGQGKDLEFVLDGKPLGNAGQTLLWPPQSGSHRLVLQSATGQIVDQVRFVVR